MNHKDFTVKTACGYEFSCNNEFVPQLKAVRCPRHGVKEIFTHNYNGYDGAGKIWHAGGV